MRINMTAIPQELLNHYHYLWDEGKITLLQPDDIVIYRRLKETMEVCRPYEKLDNYCQTRPLKIGRSLEEAEETWNAPGSLNTHLSLIAMISGMNLVLLEGALDEDPYAVNVFVVEKR